MSHMIRYMALSLLALAGTPAHAASEYGFFSLRNTDFVVLIAFVLFLGILVYFKVPGIITGMLDKRAAQIQSELDEARALREEAQTVLAGYERKQQEVKTQSERIVAHAKDEATEAAALAKADLERSIERRLKAAEEQIASAEAAAVKQVKDQAAQIAVAAAGDVIARSMNAEKANALIDDAISTVDAKLH